ncbi:MAG: aminoglycoside 3-N-acetyltransferase [Chloroflexota bacterium]|nr:aminoglycoside 3-N-acetyltransferase [Chloroflexota bacterium]
MIQQTSTPGTGASILRDIRALGVTEGSILVVHSSLSKLGWIAGGPHAVVLALLDAVGPGGTLVMPTHSSLSDPALWKNPPVPESWWRVIREETPAFDPLLTPSRYMGAIVETFRHVPGVTRSYHPSVSFAAVGLAAAQVLDNHQLADGLGEGSPLARLYELDASILLLGVGHHNNTSLHLADYRARYAGKKSNDQGAPVMVDGERRWVEFPEMDYEDADFDTLGTDFAQTGLQTTGTVGAGTARLMPQRALVDFAVRWFEEHRGSVEPTAATPGH